MPKTIRGYLCDSLLIECLPIVHILFDEFKSKRCDYCITENKTLKKCSNCKQMFYCNQLCQKNDWKSHKFECNLYKNYYKILNNHSIQRILLRLYLLIQSDPEIVTKTYETFNDKKRCLNDLMSHFDEIREDIERQSEIKAIKEDFDSCALQIPIDFLTKLFGILVINSFGIIVKDLMCGHQHCGSGLYITASVLDHSCAPNVYAVANENRLQIRAKKHIAINDDLFISYIDTQMPKSKRQTELKARYYFTCHCTRCDFSDTNENYINNNNNNNTNNEFIDDFNSRIRSLSIDQKISIDSYDPNLTFGLLEDLKIRLTKENRTEFEQQLNEYIIYVKNQICVAHGLHHYFYKLFESIVESNGFVVPIDQKPQ